MLDLKFIRENPVAVKKAVEVKCINLDVDQLLAIDSQLLTLKRESEALSSQKNTISAGIPKASKEERPALVAQSKEIGAKITEMTAKMKPLEDQLQQLMYLTPTIPSPEAPIGKSDKDNVVIKTVGEPPKFDFKPLDHVELTEKNGWADFKRVPNICGNRTYSLKGELVKLELALFQFALDKLAAQGFEIMTVPSLVSEQALYGTGHFPGDRESVYEMPKDNQFLSGTAEIVINSLHAGEILQESDLPLRYSALSPCFRREAGSAGKDVRGLIRVHQFNKVEQFIICKNDIEESKKWHQTLLNNTEDILQALEIPYHVVDCCTGDMGMGKYRMYDVESWCPSENKYRETHSCSMLLDWQARRTNTRYRDSKTGKVEFVHTLNNTEIATPRIFVPLLENHQRPDGSVRLPAAIRPYMGGVEFIGKK
jgi:seryl-tRNA synthetase